MTASHGLIVDFGGVLTTSIGDAIRAFERAEDLPQGAAFTVLADGYSDTDADHPIAGLETGTLPQTDFELALAAQFAAHGHDVDADGLVGRLLGSLTFDEAAWSVVAAARSAGVRTALLSNSWGDATTYPAERLEETFDVVVISAEVGMRKPDAAIFELTAERLGVAVERCAFVDDHDGNVRAAEALGMFGVHHRDASTTAEALSRFLGVDLTAVVDAAPSTPPGR
ncbi:MAG: HAD family phosphatase [Actinobacteria bacterium]|nr:HAD family phosphatase [Actinomycetota bacterium]